LEEDFLKQEIDSLKKIIDSLKKEIDSLHADKSKIIEGYYGAAMIRAARTMDNSGEAERRRIERERLSDEREALSNMRWELKAEKENIYALQSNLNDQVLKLGIVEGVNK
jgi:hypothetical protein